MKKNTLRVIISAAFVLFFVGCFGTIKAYALDEWFDSYGKISWTDEKARLYNFARFLRHDPEMIGYIAFNWSNKTEFVEMKRRAMRAQKFLLGKLKIDKTRIVVIKGGRREKARTVLQPSKKGLPPLDFS